ncbi:hypothetical protein [Crocinitomix catalasitica]|uniref:hypothetical protein n=1 Tax=Crocinitomix catalasitica TaxID=184607 RepID=UPI000481B5ED|nr:hypothetical protein [Crocinitomix catalasitica]
MKTITTILFSFLSIATFAQCEDFDVEVTRVDPYCYGDSTGWIEIFGVGGTEPYTVEIRNEDGDLMNEADAIRATDLPTGEYSFYIIDDAGCEIENLIIINSPDSLSFVEFGSEDGEPGGYCLLYMAASGGTPNYSYEWTLEGDPDWSFNNTTISVTQAGCYIGTVTDNYGCTLSRRTCVGWLGIEDQISEQMDLVYSMSKNTVQINGDGLAYIKLYNINGQLLVEQTLQSGMNNIIDTKLQPNMIYEVITENGMNYSGKVTQFQP